MAKRSRRRSPSLSSRTLDARPDSLDFRDQMFVPTLVEVPRKIDLEEFQRFNVPMLDQGTEGACTGFGLATVANYLLVTRSGDPDTTDVSPRMFYEMARRYDEWPGTDYSGSSARGAMKGWHKHGVCSERLWPYRASRAGSLTPERSQDAGDRPLGAYYRVNHRDLVSMHAALAEVKVLYATAIVHEGWDATDKDGAIPWTGQSPQGGHAFAIVAYDQKGFWIQNSWGDSWGVDGFARISYGDWLENATDVWVARLGVPVELPVIGSTARVHAESGTSARSYSYNNLRPHIVSVGNDGRFRTEGAYGTDEASVKAILTKDFPEITSGWKKKRLLVHSHGGLVRESSAVQRVADYRQTLLDSHIYPLAFVWKTDYWTTLKNILRDALDRRRSEGVIDGAKDFMLDRLDDALEPLARMLTGKSQWDEMKENALLATTRKTGAAYKTAVLLSKLVKEDPSVELHVVGHSAGSIFHAPLVQLLASKGTIKAGPMRRKRGLGLTIKTCTLWAPACTVDLFSQCYQPLIESGRISRTAVYVLTDEAEQDDNCANIYNKSLLYLVSNAFERQPRIPMFRDGEPILGMEKFIRADNELANVLQSPRCDLVLAPNAEGAGSINASSSRRHGDFDDDDDTLRSTISRIVGRSTKSSPVFHASERIMRRRRRAMTSE